MNGRRRDEIVLLIRSLGAGGAERQLVALARALHADGVAVSVVCFADGGLLGDELRAHGVDVDIAGKRSRFDLIGFSLRLVRALRRRRPSVIYSFLAGPNIVGAVIGRLVGRPKIVWSVRSTSIDLAREDRFVRAVWKLEPRLARRADVIIANSQAGARDAVARGFPASKMRVVPNGIDVERFRPSDKRRRETRASWGIGEDVVLVGMIGRLHPMKDHPTFLRAASEVAKVRPDVRFVSIGDDPLGLRPALEQQAAGMGLADRLTFMPSSAQIERCYPALDLLVSSSAYGEGFSNVIAEAMACGVPCVASTVGDAAEILGDGGATVEPGDPRALAAAVDGLLGRLVEGEPIGVAARRRVVENFSVARMTQETIRLIAPGRLRVAHIITGLDVGGAETALVKLACSLDRQRFSTTVLSLTTSGPMAAHLAATGVEVAAAGMGGLGGSLAGAVRLARWLRRERPDVVQTWLYKADLIGGVATRLLTRSALVWGVRQSNTDASVNSRSTVRAARLAARLSHVVPHRIACVSQEALEAHVRLGFDARRMVVTPNGFDTDRFKPDPEAGRAVRDELGLGDARVVVNVARWDPQKDHATLITAASTVLPKHRAVLVLCGRGVDAENTTLAELVRRSALEDHVRLLGERSDVERLLAAADVAVSASRGEGFSNAVGEAMAVGVPCVVTDVGNSAELVGDTGFVCPSGMPDRLADALHAMLDLDPAKRADLGAAARRRIEECWSLEAATARLESLYQEVAGVRLRGHR